VIALCLLVLGLVAAAVVRQMVDLWFKSYGLDCVRRLYLRWTNVTSVLLDIETRDRRFRERESFIDDFLRLPPNEGKPDEVIAFRLLMNWLSSIYSDALFLGARSPITGRC
jgi:hypothetical protein